MWVADAVCGQGLGGRLLDGLEEAAARAGKTVTRLETNAQLEAALAMYRRRGYVEVPPFNDEPFATHWFRKALQVRARERDRTSCSTRRWSGRHPASLDVDGALAVYDRRSTSQGGAR
jgi:hypothetical protein